jgi:hypothetical protein
VDTNPGDLIAHEAQGTLDHASHLVIELLVTIDVAVRVDLDVHRLFRRCA